MRYPLSMCVLLAVAVLAACAREAPPAPAAAESAGPADLVLVNGAIYTVDGARSWAEAVAIRDGRFVYVGTNDGAAALAGPGTRAVDLGGRMVVPGIHDIHVHPIGGGVEAMACDLNGLGSLDAYLDKVADCAREQPEREWITGGGWLMSVFGPGGMASRELLDEIVPDRPVLLTSSDGHSGWANSLALEMAGISAETPDPPDGIIDREPGSTTPLGSLQEGAISLVAAHVPETTTEERLAGLEYAIDMLNGYGITSIQDAYVFEPDLEAYRTLDERGDLDLRVVASHWWNRKAGTEQIAAFEALRDRYTRGRVKATTVKIMQDGVMENYTAALLEPYLQKDGKKGIPMVEPEALKTAVTALDAAGFQVHFHAIGDAAIRQSLDAVEAARDANGGQGLRHHISHLQLIDPADIPRFRELGVVANFQPLWACPDEYITELTLPFLGPERSRWLYPIGSVHRAGGIIAFGSDWSVSTANPFPQIEVATTRSEQDCGNGEPLLPEQALALPEAIAAFTIAGAWVNGSEQETGSIEVGKYADLAVLDRNLFEIPAGEISETRVLLTLLGGEVVHGDPAAL